VEILNFGIYGADFKEEYLKYIKINPDINVDYFVFFVDSTVFANEGKTYGPDIYLAKDSLKISYSPLHKNMQRVYEVFRVISYTGLGNLVRGAYNVYYEGRLPSVILDKLYPRNKKGQSFNKSNQDTYRFVNEKIINNLAQQNIISTNKIIIVKRDNFPTLYETYFKNKNFPYIDLSEFIDQNGGQEKLCYWKAGHMLAHWNNLGQQMIGRSLADKIYNIITTNSFKKSQAKI
jgi:hypothetical protein